MPTHIEYTRSSGNVFTDLGFQDAEERLAKAELVSRLNQLLDKKHLKQTAAAKILGINQPKISALQRGQLAGFSMERLISFLNKLDQDIEIIVKDKPKRRKSPAHLRVAFG
jgi:predicted XRE-type DNA-binding protein